MSDAKNSFFDNRRSVFLLMIFHLLIALPLAFFVNIWVDEASTIHTTGNGFFFALQHAFETEKQAPLYFWVLSLWRGINDSIFFARLFSIIFSLLAIKFFHDLARNFFSEKQSLSATAFFALHPYLIWASLEIRLYSTVIFLSILILSLFVEIFLKEISLNAPKSRDILFIVFSSIALYTNYYLGFLLVGCFAALLVLQKWTAARKYLLQMLVVGLFFLPLLWAMKSQLAVNSTGFQAERSLIEGLQLLWSYFLAFTLPTEILPRYGTEITAVSFFRLWFIRLLVLAAAIFLVKTRKIFDKNILAVGTICAVISAFLLFAYFVLGAKYVALRHAAVLFVPVILLISLVTKAFFERFHRKAKTQKSAQLTKFAALALTILTAAFFAYSIFTLHPNFTKRGDWARIASFIEANEKENQPILIFPNYDALALPVYYKGVNKVLPDEKFFDWELEAAPDSADSAKNQIEFILSKIPANSNEIWLLTDSSCQSGQRCQPLENFVEANYTIVEEKVFYEEKVRLLRKNRND